MIYIACAMYMEAAPFIRRFACKRDDAFRHEQVFVGEEAVVIITGTSPVPAAIALTETLALLPPGEADIFANVGLCGCSDTSVDIGTLFLVHSIADDTTGRRFYPDLLYLHEHCQGALTTYASVVTDNPSDAFLFDTEAAGLYQAALPYFSADRMFYFKIVSDCGSNASDISPTQVYELLEGNAPVVSETLLRFASYVPRRYRYSEDEEAVIDYFCRSLRCSVTMEHELRRLIQYYEMERGYAIAHIREFLGEYGLDFETDVLLRSRKEGKDVLDAFRLSCLC
jgi:Phosphorylase superfamily.